MSIISYIDIMMFVSLKTADDTRFLAFSLLFSWACSGFVV